MPLWQLFVDAWELRRGTLEWNDYCSVLFQLLEVAREASVRNVGEFQARATPGMMRSRGAVGLNRATRRNLFSSDVVFSPLWQVLEAAYPALRQMGQAKGHPLQAQLAKRLGMVAVAPWIRLKGGADLEETETARCGGPAGPLMDLPWQAGGGSV